MEANAPRVTNLDDIRANDALVFQDGEHVGLIYSVSRFTAGIPGETRQGVYCGIAEATNNDMNFFGKSGLNLNDYRVMQNANGGFSVRRPLDNQSGFHEPPVFIVRPVA